MIAMRSLEHSTPLLVSGMLWSGSSAVVDALSQCADVATVSGELKFFSHWVAPRYAMLSLLQEQIGDSEVFYQVAYDLMSLRLRVSRLPGGFYRRKFRRIRRILAIAATRILGPAPARRFVNRLGDTTPIGSAELLTAHLAKITADSLRESARWHQFTIETFWDAASKNAVALLDQIARSRRFVVCDQAVPILARDLPKGTRDGLAFYPGSTQFAVYRDPADQLTDFMVKGGSEQWKRVFASRMDGYEGSETERFCAWQLESLQLLCELTRSNPGRVVPVKFEDFVLNYTDWKARLSSSLGLVFPEGVRDRFDPSRSVKNVGIYRATLNTRQVAEINSYRPQFEELWHRLGQFE
jgi:hypothetical protein